MVYDIGDVCRISAIFTDGVTGVPVDPTTMAVKVKNSAGTTATYALGGASPPIKLATGSYYLDLPILLGGSHRWRWEASGPNSAEEGVIPVHVSAF